MHQKQHICLQEEESTSVPLGKLHSPRVTPEEGQEEHSPHSLGHIKTVMRSVHDGFFINSQIYEEWGGDLHSSDLRG